MEGMNYNRMVNILNWIRGYLKIRVSGFSPERFMNLCRNRDILLWDISKDDDIFYMKIHKKNFFRLKSITKKTGTKVAILKKYGLPFILPGILKRKIFIFGLALACSFWIWTSGYIWDIEISGNHQITEDVFQEFLINRNVFEGMSKRKLDISTLEKDIRKEFQKVTWASAKLIGTKLLIEIKENDAPIIQNAEKEEEGYDLVCEHDGKIVSIVVRSGVPMVKPGDIVEKGTVLVDGKIPVYNEDNSIREYIFVDSDADIIMEYQTSYMQKIPYDYITKYYTGRERTTNYLRIGNKILYISVGKPYFVCDCIVKETQPVFLKKLRIPLFFGNRKYREYQNVEKRYSMEEAKSVLSKINDVFMKSLSEKGVQIIEKDVKIDKSDDFWVLTNNVLIQEKIGKKSITQIPETGEMNHE